MGLSTLQTLMKTHLDAHNYFSDASSGTPKPISVIVDDVADIQTEIDKHVKKAIGIVVVIGQPYIVNLEPKVHIINADVHFVVSVIENVILNRAATGTGKKAMDVAQAILQRLHGVQFSNHKFGRLQLREGSPQQIVKPFQMYHVPGKAGATLGPLQTVPVP